MTFIERLTKRIGKYADKLEQENAERDKHPSDVFTNQLIKPTILTCSNMVITYSLNPPDGLIGLAMLFDLEANQQRIEQKLKDILFLLFRIPHLKYSRNTKNPSASKSSTCKRDKPTNQKQIK